MNVIERQKFHSSLHISSPFLMDTVIDLYEALKNRFEYGTSLEEDHNIQEFEEIYKYIKECIEK